MVEDAVSGAEFALAFQLWLLPACLPASSAGWIALLCCSLSPLFCERARKCLRLELFAGKFSLSFLFFSPLSGYPRFGLLSHISSLRLPSGHSGPVLTLGNAATPACSTPTCWWRMQASGLLLLWELQIGAVISGFYLFFPSQLYCPLRFQNSPQTRK